MKNSDFQKNKLILLWKPTARNVKTVMALLDLTDAKLQEDGTVKGLSEQIEKLAKAKDSKFLFEEAEAKPKFKGFQPGASSEKGTAL